MKPLSQHIQETFNNESLKEAFEEKLVDEELDALNRTAFAIEVPKADKSSLVDKTISGK
ncbi:hypothetical protein [Flavobacterium pectinovorum]|uniref:hypothetical protein n=1 Tax=Flavobacterium pectinovorum TaxID=29533 RepID=UPI001375795B|nr:hypothetical protein [Flavobacterium pectinovorum]